MLAYVIYLVLKLIRETRAGSARKRILFLVIVGYYVSRFTRSDCCYIYTETGIEHRYSRYDNPFPA